MGNVKIEKCENLKLTERKLEKAGSTKNGEIKTPQKWERKNSTAKERIELSSSNKELLRKKTRHIDESRGFELREATI